MPVELDKEVVLAVFGSFTDDPDRCTQTKEDQWYFHPKYNKVYHGRAYLLSDDEEGKWYARMWDAFLPSENIKDAWFIVEHIRSLEWGIVVEDYPAMDGASPFWRCLILRKYKHPVLDDGPTAPEAICRAVLKTLRES